MGFRLFGIEVEIQPSFFLLVLFFSAPGFFGMGGGTSLDPAVIVMIAAVLFISVLVHELGHAFAIRAHRIQPEIVVHGMGGHTMWRALLPLRRIDLVGISLAGPIAGLTLAGIAYGVTLLPLGKHFMPGTLGYAALTNLWQWNLFWSALNLVPALPFDGGHVLEHALGPRRTRITASISMLVSVLGLLYMVSPPGPLFTFVMHALGYRVYPSSPSPMGIYFFARSAYLSFLMFRSASAVKATFTPRKTATPGGAMTDLPAVLAAMLRDARSALADEDLDRATALGARLLSAAEQTSGAAGQKAAAGALHVLAWARYLEGKIDEAEDLAKQAGRRGPLDPALSGALLMARQNGKEARRVLEAARAAGDDRKEIVGPLIQVLLEQGEVERAAAIAFDVVESLSADDVRRMATLAFEGGAFDWSGRLYEAVFRREKRAEDAYAAARASAKNGEPDRALDLLKRAVDAGFSDRARAWSDAALSSLREGSGGLEAVVPRP